jgi:hypothetical protein
MRAVLARAFAIAATVIAAGPRLAAGDPIGSRLLTAPTAWLPPAGAATATLGIDHRGDTLAAASASLGGLAELEIDEDTDVRACSGCDHPAPLRLGRAAFRIGARQGAWLAGMPALVLGVRTAFAAYEPSVPSPRVSDAYVVASRALGAIWLHAGADAIAAETAGQGGTARLRPLAGLEIHPPMYPRSTLIGDIAWEPELDAMRAPALRWLLGVGVRYQAFDWAQIELAVRARQGEDLGASTVLIRVNAIARR